MIQDIDNQKIEARAQYMWLANSANDPDVHCNRFPSWSELSESTREEYRGRARRAIEDE